jgi:Pretoxin HINT domain
VKDVGWVAARDLAAGSLLETKGESWLGVEKVDRHTEVATVYNFEVQGFHTYFVSDLGLLVHNSCPIILAQNRAQGELGEAEVLARLLNSRNVRVVGTQVRVRTPGNPNSRIIDILIERNRDGVRTAIEVKTGNAVRNSSQIAKDAELATGVGTTFYGRAARNAGIDGQATGAIRTVVSRPF